MVYVDEADIYFDVVQVPEAYYKALDFFRKHFDDVEEDGAVFMFVKGSMGIYAEDADEDEYYAILFARKDYYND